MGGPWNHFGGSFVSRSLHVAFSFDRDTSMDDDDDDDDDDDAALAFCLLLVLVGSSSFGDVEFRDFISSRYLIKCTDYTTKGTKITSNTSPN
jgi:hypothetical protein